MQYGAITLMTTDLDISATLDNEENKLLQQRDDALELAIHKPTQVNLRALKKCETVLAEFRSARYEPVIDETFAALPDVITYLDAEGWKISTSSAYEHKSLGKIRPNADGKYSLSAVMEYATSHLQRKDGSSGSGNLQERKIYEEIRRISSDAEMRELKLRERIGELISREQVEVELAARAGDLKTHLDASARSSATRIIKLVGGDQQKAPELISFMLGINRKVLDNYSRPINGLDEEDDQ